jgi:hypothetical protein
MNAQQQQVVHLLVVLFCLFGIFCCLYNRRSVRAPLATNLCLIALLGHLFWLLFQSIGRYAYTSIPFVIVFAGYGMFALQSYLLTGRQRGVLLASCSSIACLGILLYLGVADHAQEVGHRIMPGQTLEKHIDLKGCDFTAAPSIAFILIDGNKDLESASITLNGNILPDRIRSFNHFDSSKYCLFNTMAEHAGFLQVSVDDFRQWRAIPIPEKLLNLHGTNTVCLNTPAPDSIVYGDIAHDQRTMLSPDYFAFDKMMSLPVSMETRLYSPTRTGRIIESSWIHGNRNQVQRLPDSLRIKLALAYDSKAGGSIETCHAFQYNLPAASFSLLARDPDGKSIRLNYRLLKLVGSITGSASLPNMQGSHLSVTVGGKCRLLKGPGDLGILVLLHGQGGQVNILGKNPGRVRVTKSWTEFSIQDLIPCAYLGYQPRSIEVCLYPCPWHQAQYLDSSQCSDIQIRDLTICVQPEQLPDLSNHHIYYY